ncbi:hypothetical protein FHS39_004378 [Streptomyces olivoverticillatus]|uniref:Uncharacterized protein n=1 Tax=Streptomyces olivoverticillatus TaxID=66427 RepID=A0A7W7PLH4_9ACTN|nr:hypothetical protein [Streptomyces olivoverticillatus]MBB4895311.1 hypothetical protein [Streptomyces olivoverticillatus]
MAHTHKDRRRPTARRRQRPTARRRLRSETPSTVAVLAVPRDFAAMRRYTSFDFDDHATYLEQVEGLLRALTAQGTYTSVALFDPVGFEEYCTELHLDPDTPASRTRYTAEIAAAGTKVPYEGQPLSRLLPRLVDDTEQHATWEYASALLQSGDCASCGEDIGRAAFARASKILRRLLEAVGTGTHHLVCSVPAEGQTPLIAVLPADCAEDGTLHMGEAAALVFCTVLAAGIATNRPGGVVMRSTTPGRPVTVRGWKLKDGGLRPLTEAEVFSAYCTDAETGEPVPPEHGVAYREGIRLDLD